MSAISSSIRLNAKEALASPYPTAPSSPTTPSSSPSSQKAVTTSNADLYWSLGLQLPGFLENKQQELAFDVAVLSYEISENLSVLQKVGTKFPVEKAGKVIATFSKFQRHALRVHERVCLLRRMTNKYKDVSAITSDEIAFIKKINQACKTLIKTTSLVRRNFSVMVNGIRKAEGGYSSDAIHVSSNLFVIADAFFRGKSVKVVRKIGRGCYGTVHQIMIGRRHFAAKQDIDDFSGRERIMEENKLLARVPSHPNVIGTGVIVRNVEGCDDEPPLLILPLLRGDLSSGGRLTALERVNIIRGVAKGLAHLHKHGVIHRDIKPDNILLDKALRAVIADFGFSVVREGMEEVDGTGLCTPIEKSSSDEYSTITGAIDTWAFATLAIKVLFGVTLEELLYSDDLDDGIGSESRNPHHYSSQSAKMTEKQIERAIDKLGGGYAPLKATSSDLSKLSSEKLNQFQNFLTLALKISPDERITLEEVLEMPFFLENHTSSAI